MIVRSRFVLSALVAAALCAAVPAFASQQLREPKAHMVVDVPDAWKTFTDGDYVVAAPQDNSFHLRILGTTKGAAGEQDAETTLSARMAKHLDGIKISAHAKQIDWNNYSGYEIFGTGMEHSGAPAKFFAIIVTDKKDATKGAVVLGSGTLVGFDKHQPGIHEALRTLRSY